MLCSADELGLPKGEDGLLILSPEAQPGTPLSDLFPGDTILDLEITPNRPDLLSMNGIAREIAALTGRPARLVAPRAEATLPAESTLQVSATECPLYTARKIRGSQSRAFAGMAADEARSARAAADQ
jgi:phenylalanyl-tRNA synthetase beta chain